MKKHLFLPFLIGLFLMFAPILNAQERSEPRKTRQGYLGVQPVSLNDGFRDMLETEREHGVVLVQVVPDSPADEAGLRRLDLLLRINQTDVTSVEDLAAAVREASPGTEVTLTVLRNGNTLERTVTLGRHPDSVRAGSSKNRTGPANQAEDTSEGPGDVEEFAERLEKLDGDREPTGDHSPEKLREQMKQFLNEHPPDQKSEEKEEGSTKRHQFKKFLKRLKKEYGEALREKLIPETRRQFRRLIKEFRGMMKDEKLNAFRDEMRAYLRYLKEHRLDKLTSPETTRHIKGVLKKWNRRFSRSMKRFEKTFDRNMDRYMKRLDRQMKELKKLKERLQSSAEEDPSEETERGRPDQKQPFLGVHATANPEGDGLLVRAVADGAPADRAGLRGGDVILGMDGSAHGAVDGFREALFRHRPGDRVKLRVSRNGWKKVLKVELGARDRKEGRPSTPNSGGESSGDRSRIRAGTDTGEDRGNGSVQKLFGGVLSSVVEDVVNGKLSLDRIHALLDMARWQLNRRQVRLTGAFSVRDGEGRVLFQWSGQQNPVQMIKVIEFLLPK